MIQITRKNKDSFDHGTSLASAFDSWKGSAERLLFVAPHDDDLCLGSGLLLQAAVQAGAQVKVIITSDGSMGFGSSCSKEEVVAVRKKETLSSFAILGVSDVSWLDFPDGSLHLFAGIRTAVSGDPCVIEGHTGLQNAYTATLRSFRPSRVFVPAGSDLHPDHKVVYQDLLISLFHASGDIWPQLGQPLETVPDIFEMAIYCDFPGPPTIMLESNDLLFEKKIASVMAYESQQQIAALVANMRASGAVEFFRPAAFNLYEAGRHRQSFLA